MSFCRGILALPSPEGRDMPLAYPSGAVGEVSMKLCLRRRKVVVYKENAGGPHPSRFACHLPQRGRQG